MECSSTNWTWIKAVRLAEDCQSYNLELRSHGSKPTFNLTTTKRIQPNECPVLWFSQEILISLRVPHLSLTNIQGKKDSRFSIQFKADSKITRVNLQDNKISKIKNFLSNK